MWIKKKPLDVATLRILMIYKETILQRDENTSQGG